LCKNFKSIPDAELFEAIDHYDGRHSNPEIDVRHLKPDQKVAGNVGREISAMIREHLQKHDYKIQLEDRLFVWYGLYVPKKLLNTVECCTIMAGKILANGSKNYWNQNTPVVKEDDPLYDLDALKKAFIGCLIRRQLVSNFREQTKNENSAFYRSSELIDIYQKLSNEKKEIFNTHYSIAKSQSDAASVEQINALTTAMKKIQMIAERQENAEILKVCSEVQGGLLLAED
jgi:hypothetical protein